MSGLPLTHLEVFLAIARAGSLRAAAADLGVQPPAVSYRLKALEEVVGVSLFARSTRSIRLTEAGRALLARVQPAMQELRAALEESRGIGKARKGSLRISLPYVAYQLTLAPRLAALRERCPELELELSFDEGFVDIVEAGFHAGIRMGDLIQEDMIAVRLTPPMKQVCFAGPSYLDRRGRPRRPRDLLRHDCIRYRYIGSGRIAEWQFRGAGGIATVEVKGSLVMDSTEAVLDAARRNLGVSWLFRPNIEEDLRVGRLESLLDGYAIERPGFFLYYPKASARLEILRLFIEQLKYRPAPG